MQNKPYGAAANQVFIWSVEAFKYYIMLGMWLVTLAVAVRYNNI